MPCLLHTAHISSHYSAKIALNSPSSNSLLVRRGGDGDPAPILIIIVGIVGAIGLVLLLLGWAKKSHAKAYAKQRARGARGGQVRPARRAGARHGGGSHRSGRSRVADEEAGGYPEDDGYGMQAPPSAYMPGDPPSYRTKPDVRFPGPRYGYGGNDGRQHRAQSVGDYMSDRSGHPGRFGAPSASEYFDGR